MGLAPETENGLEQPVGYPQQFYNILLNRDSQRGVDHNDLMKDIQGRSRLERTAPRVESRVKSFLTSRKFFYHVFQAIKSRVDRQLPFHRRSPWGRATKAWPVLTSPF